MDKNLSKLVTQKLDKWKAQIQEDIEFQKLEQKAEFDTKIEELIKKNEVLKKQNSDLSKSQKKACSNKFINNNISLLAAASSPKIQTLLTEACSPKIHNLQQQ